VSGGISIDQALQLATDHHRRGQLREAEAIYRQILQAQPNHAAALHYLGVLAHQVGRHDLALPLIDQSIALTPNDASYHSNRSEVLRALGRPADALEALRRALALRPGDADFTGNLGVALFDSGDLAGARDMLGRAIQIDPSLPEPHLHLSRVLKALDRIDDALAEARRAVDVAPGHVNALLNLAMTLLAAKQLDEAAELARRCVDLSPNYALAQCGVGSVLAETRRFEDAAAAYTRAIELDPTYEPAYAGLGAVMANLGRHEESIGLLSRAVEIRPTDHAAHNSLGLAYLSTGRFTDAMAEFRTAAQADPKSAEYLNNLASAIESLGGIDEALKLVQQAAALAPESALVRNNLAKRLIAIAQLDEGVAQARRAVELSPSDSRIHDNLLLTLHYLPDIPPAEMLQEHLAWAARHAQPLARSHAAHANNRDPNRRLKIGYVSPDFAAHAVADFIEPILAHHDHERFEIICYSDVPVPDAYTRRIRPHADGWRDISRENDDRVSAIIGEQQIDILVDLAGHTARNRMLVFARKPAPVQVTYLGYPDTTGQTAIDWRITDTLADPPGATEAYHTEKLLRLPRTFLCYQPYGDSPAIGPLPADLAGHTTFASFNNLSKLTPRAIETWSRILWGVPRSRLLIKAVALEETARRLIRDAFAAHGIGSERLELIGRVHAFADHLALYNKVDVALDTFPYHGTTTTCEALWMGAAVVTLAGEIHMSRVGVSLLGQVGLSDLVAGSADDYVAIATGLANDRDRMRGLRSSLRERMTRSPLLDAIGVTRELESAYRSIWTRWATR
jgi:protein O-GlcNAc transferase